MVNNFAQEEYLLKTTYAAFFFTLFLWSSLFTFHRAGELFHTSVPFAAQFHKPELQFHENKIRFHYYEFQFHGSEVEFHVNAIVHHENEIH